MLTKEEKSWIKKVEKLLESCPERFGLYTIGDASLGVYDNTKEPLFDTREDLVGELMVYDAYLGQIRFPTNVPGVAG